MSKFWASWPYKCRQSPEELSAEDNCNKIPLKKSQVTSPATGNWQLATAISRLPNWQQIIYFWFSAKVAKQSALICEQTPRGKLTKAPAWNSVCNLSGIYAIETVTNVLRPCADADKLHLTIWLKCKSQSWSLTIGQLTCTSHHPAQSLQLWI